MLLSAAFLIPAQADLAQRTAKGGYSLGDKKWETIEILTESAGKGDPIAMYVLAWVYDEGAGAVENDTLAETWYGKSAPEIIKLAQTGNVDALLIAADLYSEGYGVPKSEKKAFEMYQKAAEKGSAIGLYELAECYDDGDGVTEDKSKAQEYYKQATAKGHAKAKQKCL